MHYFFTVMIISNLFLKSKKELGLYSKIINIHTNFLNILRRKLSSCIYLLKIDLIADLFSNITVSNSNIAFKLNVLLIT